MRMVQRMRGWLIKLRIKPHSQKSEKKIKTLSEETVDSVVCHISKRRTVTSSRKDGIACSMSSTKMSWLRLRKQNVLKKIPVAEGVKASLDNTKELLQQCMSLLGKRQKQIKMVYWSEQGWAVVQDYDADALANNSDDKKIKKAVKAAEKKAVAVAKKRKSTKPSVSLIPSGSTAMFQKLEHPVVLGPAQQSLLLKPSGTLSCMQFNPLSPAITALNTATFVGAVHS